MSSQFTLVEQRAHREKLIYTLRHGHEPDVKVRFNKKQYEPLVVNGRYNPDGYSWPAVAWSVRGISRDARDDNQFDHTASHLAEDVADWLGFTDHYGKYKDDDGITHFLVNDNSKSFEEIADMIEQEPEGLLQTEESIPTYQWETGENGSITRTTHRKFLNDSGEETITLIIQPNKEYPDNSDIVIRHTTTWFKDDLAQALESAHSSSVYTHGRRGRIRHMVDGKEIGISGWPR